MENELINTEVSTRACGCEKTIYTYSTLLTNRTFVRIHTCNCLQPDDNRIAGNPDEVNPTTGSFSFLYDINERVITTLATQQPCLREWLDKLVSREKDPQTSSLAEMVKTGSPFAYTAWVVNNGNIRRNGDVALGLYFPPDQYKKGETITLRVGNQFIGDIVLDGTTRVYRPIRDEHFLPLVSLQFHDSVIHARETPTKRSFIVLGAQLNTKNRKALVHMKGTLYALSDGTHFVNMGGLGYIIRMPAIKYK